MFWRRSKLSDEKMRREIGRKQLESLHRTVTRPRSEWIGQTLVVLGFATVVLGPTMAFIVKSRWGIDEARSS